MPVIIGIDAAWTNHNPSGISLVTKAAGGWRLKAVAPSFQCFLAQADRSFIPEPRRVGLGLEVMPLLETASRLCDQPVELVAIDMPLARSPIQRRRLCDNLVSKQYAAQKCGTHSPNSDRPGDLGRRLQEEFANAGFPLLTNKGNTGLIEVYPHPALVALTRASERLPYKTSKTRSYWPSATPAERRCRLIDQWNEIVMSLEREIGGAAEALPVPQPDAATRALKAYEDSLDAVICAWVGICFLEGRAQPLGDDDAAIWIPNATA